MRPVKRGEALLPPRIVFQPPTSPGERPRQARSTLLPMVPNRSSRSFFMGDQFDGHSVSGCCTRICALATFCSSWPTSGRIFSFCRMHRSRLSRIRIAVTSTHMIGFNGSGKTKQGMRCACILQSVRSIHFRHNSIGPKATRPDAAG